MKDWELRSEEEQEARKKEARKQRILEISERIIERYQNVFEKLAEYERKEKKEAEKNSSKHKQADPRTQDSCSKDEE